MSPPRNTNAVAIAGNNAHGPGNLVVSVNNTTQQQTATKPIQADTPLKIFAVLLVATGRTANNAPIDNSNARVWGAKNAQGCDVFMRTMHIANEATETTVASMPTLRRIAIRDAAPTQTSANTAGHTK